MTLSILRHRNAGLLDFLSGGTNFFECPCFLAECHLRALVCMGWDMHYLAVLDPSGSAGLQSMSKMLYSRCRTRELWVLVSRFGVRPDATLFRSMLIHLAHAEYVDRDQLDHLALLGRHCQLDSFLVRYRALFRDHRELAGGILCGARRCEDRPEEGSSWCRVHRGEVVRSCSENGVTQDVCVLVSEF
jgi:hypothetical protein